LKYKTIIPLSQVKSKVKKQTKTLAERVLFRLMKALTLPPKIRYKEESDFTKRRNNEA
jgi:hypothetical protein